MTLRHIDRAFALFAVLGFSACAGTASTGTAGTGSPTVPQSDARVTLAAPTPAPTPGFTALATSYVLLEPVGGRAVRTRVEAAPPPQGWALAFNENGDFLGALKSAELLPERTSFELDVLAVPAPGGTNGTASDSHAIDIAQSGWTLSGGPQPLGGGFTAQPYAVRLASVAQLAPGATVPFATSPSFFVWNGSGTLLGAFDAPGRLPGQYTVPAGSPVTVVDTTTSWPESHCGNCWLVLQH
jgi:hypothetical protein